MFAIVCTLQIGHLEFSFIIHSSFLTIWEISKKEMMKAY